MKNKNMFNIVKKGIIRSAALLLLAGFCGNVSADLDEFVNVLTKDDNYNTRIAEENSGSINVLNKNVFNAQDIKTAIGENSPEYGQVLTPLFQTLNDYHKDIFHKDYPFNKFATIIGDKKLDIKIDNDDMKKEVSNIVDSVVADLLILRDMRTLLEEKNNELEAAENAKDDWKGMDAKDIIDGNANVQALAQQRQNLEDQMKALLDWNNEDNNPVVDGFDDSELKALVGNLQKNVIELQDGLNVCNAVITAFNKRLLKEDSTLDPDVRSVENNLSQLITKLKNQIVDVDTLDKNALANNKYVKVLTAKLQQLVDVIKESNRNIKSLQEDKDNLIGQLNEAQEAKEKAENALNELNTKSEKQIAEKSAEISKLNEEILKLQSEIELKKNNIIALEEKNKELLSKVELFNSNTVTLMSQLADMQNKLQLAGDTNNFENDDEEELDERGESSTPSNESVKNEEFEDEHFVIDENEELDEKEESSTPSNESVKNEESEDEQVETMNVEDVYFDLDNLLKEANALNETIKKPSASASRPATKTKTHKSSIKTNTVKDSYILEGVDTEDFYGTQVFNIPSLSSATSKTEKKDSKSKSDDFMKGLEDLL